VKLVLLYAGVNVAGLAASLGDRIVLNGKVRLLGVASADGAVERTLGWAERRLGGEHEIDLRAGRFGNFLRRGGGNRCQGISCETNFPVGLFPRRGRA